MPHGEQIDDRELLVRRAVSFGGAADVYEKARPGYPAAAVRGLLGADPLDVLDLGAGTGKLTRTLVAEGHRVQAVDPSEGMLAVLAVAVPGVARAVGSAESLPAADSSVDAVVAAQAYHWFDPATALPEIARVLRPGGLLGLLWNVRDDRVDWVPRFGDLVGREDAGDLMRPPTLGELFTPPRVHWYEHKQAMTVGGLVDLAASRSSVIVLPEAERADRLEQVRALGQQVAVGGTLRMPYRLQVWSARVV